MPLVYNLLSKFQIVDLCFVISIPWEEMITGLGRGGIFTLQYNIDVAIDISRVQATVW